MANPLTQMQTLPPFGDIEAVHMEPAISEILSALKAGISAITEAAGAPNFVGVVKARDELEDRLQQAWSPIGHLNGVMNSAEIREAHQACLALITDYYTEVGQNRVLFEQYQAIRASDQFDALSTAEKKVVDNALLDFRLSGVDLSGDEKSAFSEAAKRLSELNSKFNNNVLDATQAWFKLMDDASSLSGVPKTALALMAQNAKNEGQTGYRLTLDGPSYLAVMTYCEDQGLRKELYLAYGTRASQKGPNAGEYDNTEVMQEILTLRRQQAQRLGFANYGELSVARKMARSTDEVLMFLNDLAAKSKVQAQEDLDGIADFAQTHAAHKSLEPWDVPYFAEKLKKARFDISVEELRPYFPAPKVLEGMFEVVRRLFDIEVRPAASMPVWHKHAHGFEILKGGQIIAGFYIDLYARANKRGGAWMDDCRVRRMRLNGDLQLPVAYLTCNFSAPVGDDPSLLSHNEVVTLFHEFGHGLHHMMTSIDTAGVSGINGVAWDAVELPSQFMENFCWQEESLALISGHYQTGEALPKDMLNKLLEAKNFQAAMMMVRQLEFALFDFRLHVEFDPESADQIQRVLTEVREQVAVLNPPMEYAFQHGFSHVFGGGYAAGYYSYKWAEVLSADAFSKFLEDGIFNRQTGEKFLQAILEKGGSEDAMDLFVAFRGREPEVEALLRQDGIAA
ncbi:MAG: oligopeptidase A [Candidatus Azotimanducaceae bacterium]|jgi:oligopeptidase A